MSAEVMVNYNGGYKLHKFLSDSGCIDDIYEALEHDDISDVVITAMNILKATDKMPEFKKVTKNEFLSTVCRNQGNQFYAMNHFEHALKTYNKAILFAPNKSEAMKLAYGNRSALLFTVQAYSASLRDIETVLAMGCNYQLAEKLRKRKNDCISQVRTESLRKSLLASPLEKYFNFDAKRHPEIPCVSTDVNVIIESQIPKVVAANDIPVGKVVALEAPFACHLSTENYLTSCYYCHKLSLNLIPCDNCCYVMFCSLECKINCNNEYHGIECQIMEFVEDLSSSTRLTIKAVIKMKQECKSWDELVEASHSVGIERMKKSSINEIFDVNNKFSILNCDNYVHFFYGELYNSSFICAAMIYHLGKVPSFLPKDDVERDEAMRALARIMVHLYLSCKKVAILNSAKDVLTGNISNDTVDNFGWFSFTSKLSHACDANLLSVGVKNNIALIALEPIRKGTELKISYIGHWFENMLLEKRYSRQKEIFNSQQRFCRCRVCEGNWQSRRLASDKMTRKPKMYEKWLQTRKKNFVGQMDMFRVTCDALGQLHNVAVNTEEHHELYAEFRAQINFAQYLATQNVIISTD